jgi:hypothetical protein
MILYIFFFFAGVFQLMEMNKPDTRASDSTKTGDFKDGISGHACFLRQRSGEAVDGEPGDFCGEVIEEMFK